MQKLLVALFAILVLVTPAIIQALAQTKINLLVTLVIIFIYSIVAIYKPRLIWISSIMSSMLIVLASYPIWIFTGREKTWLLYLEGLVARLTRHSILVVILFSVAILMLFSLHWALQKNMSQKL